MNELAGPSPDPDPATEPKRFVRRPGWLPSACAAVLLLATGGAIILTANSLTFFVAQVVGLGLVLALLGLIIGSENLIAVAVVPMLGSSLIGVGEASGADWRRALIIGCLLYVSMEVAWSGLAQRAGTGWNKAIAVQRAREVAAVTATALVAGLAAIELTSLAPARTLLVRGVIAAALLLALIAALQHLSSTAPPPEEPP